MATIPDGAVIVGVSTRSGSPAALQWGAKYAKVNKLPLVAVMVYRQPRPPATPSVRPPAVSRTAPDDSADDVLAKLSSFVKDALGTKHSATLGLLRGSPSVALRRLSQGANIIVLGSPRDTTVSAHRVAGKLIHEAECPVLVMPPVAHPPEGKVRATGKKIAKATADAAAKSGRPGLRPPRT
ncbi:universal stress protein [Epidermidibacterium keratini]|uniref:Universal stress protein n=1 Tax=Epidermidibacterium keratini TaxID=1891644 RepID=A0A7L4YSW8_9ACTN|nr:universal stress protein [Epidermidibacterium keratini]QHC02004.1 universal stress protein [Epidermidibacterium keratini]